MQLVHEDSRQGAMLRAHGFDLDINGQLGHAGRVESFASRQTVPE